MSDISGYDIRPGFPISRKSRGECIQSNLELFLRSCPYEAFAQGIAVGVDQQQLAYAFTEAFARDAYR